MSDEESMIYEAVEEAKKMSEADKIKALMSLCLNRMQELRGEEVGMTGLNKEDHPFEYVITLGLITMARASGIMSDEEMRRILQMDVPETLN